MPTEMVPITVTQTARGAAWALADDGRSAFIPSTVAEKVQAEVGGRYMARLIENKRPKVKTPWFAAFATRISDDDENALLVADLLKSWGGVWRPDDIAKSLNLSPADACNAAMQAHYRRHISMFVLHVPGSPDPKRRWFTAYPDHADVDEWADDA